MNDRTQLSVFRIATVAATCALLGLTACGKKEAAPDKAGKSAADQAPKSAATDRDIKIISIKPEVEAFKAGESVKLALSASYTLPAQGGLVGLVVQDAMGTQLADKLTPVEGGSGTFVGEVEFKVPATDRLTLIVPLYVKGENKSAVSTTREFTVKAK
jgi:hypothetical protein